MSLTGEVWLYLTYTLKIVILLHKNRQNEYPQKSLKQTKQSKTMFPSQSEVTIIVCVAYAEKSYSRMWKSLEAHAIKSGPRSIISNKKITITHVSPPM